MSANEKLTSALWLTDKVWSDVDSVHELTLLFLFSFSSIKMTAAPYNYSYIFKYIIIGKLDLYTEGGLVHT